MTNQKTKQDKPLFKVGETFTTPAALSKLTEISVSPCKLVDRHVTGDWKEMSECDQESNRQAVIEHLQVFSAYSFDGVKFWVITEGDRSCTTILLPEDY